MPPPLKITEAQILAAAQHADTWLALSERLAISLRSLNRYADAHNIRYAVNLALQGRKPITVPALRRLSRLLTALDPADTEGFLEVFTGAVELLGLPDSEVADEAQVAESNVSRWRRGETSPRSDARDRVIGWLRRRVEGELHLRSRQ